jgi:predicted transcriptional regulator
MNFIDKKQKIDYLLELVQKEDTGTACDLSKRLCVSKRTFTRLLQNLRELGYQIGFCSQRRTYNMIRKLQD